MGFLDVYRISLASLLIAAIFICGVSTQPQLEIGKVKPSFNFTRPIKPSFNFTGAIRSSLNFTGVIRPSLNFTGVIRPSLNFTPIFPNEDQTSCDYKVSGEKIYMKVSDVFRVYRPYFKTSEELGVRDCSPSKICLDTFWAERPCRRSASSWYCPMEARSRRGLNSACRRPAVSDWGKCCETCTTPARVTWPLSHPTHGSVYVVEFPSLDLYQPFSLGTCGLRRCKNCVQKTALYTFLVSTIPVVDPPTPATFIPLIFHTEELPAYCTCVRL